MFQGAYGARYGSRPLSAGGAHQYPWGTVPQVDDKPRNPYVGNEYGIGYLDGGRPLSGVSTGATSYGISLSRPESGNTFAYSSRPQSRSSAAGLGQSRRARSASRSRPLSGYGSIGRPGTAVSRERPSTATFAPVPPGRSVPERPATATAASRGAYVARPHDREVHRPRPLTHVPRTDRWHGLGAVGSEPRIERAQSAPGLRPRSAKVVQSARVARPQNLDAEFEMFAEARPIAPRLMPLRPDTTSATLSGMKKEIAQLKANSDELQDGCDAAQQFIDDFRHKHTFPQMCEDLKATLWPEIKAAHEEITNMFEEERRETYELSQQVELLTHEKNSIAYVLYRMDQQVSEIERTIGHR